MRCGALLGQDDRLSAHAASGFQNRVACRVNGVLVQQFFQCIGLIEQSAVFFSGVSVDIVVHNRSLWGVFLKQFLSLGGRTDILLLNFFVIIVPVFTDLIKPVLFFGTDEQGRNLRRSAVLIHRHHSASAASSDR